jgi:hypothetical protein
MSCFVQQKRMDTVIVELEHVERAGLTFLPAIGRPPRKGREDDPPEFWERLHESV